MSLSQDDDLKLFGESLARILENPRFEKLTKTSKVKVK